MNRFTFKQTIIMKLHLPITLLAAVMSGIGYAGDLAANNSGTISVGDGTYEYSTDADGVVNTTFTGDGTTGDLGGGYGFKNKASSTPTKGHIGAVAPGYVAQDNGDKNVAAHTNLTIGGVDEDGNYITTKLNRVTAGVRGYVVSGNKTVTVKEGATVGLLLGGYDVGQAYGTTLSVPGAQRYGTIANGEFAPKSSSDSVISINVEGGEVSQLYTSYVAANLIANEISGAKKALSGEALDAYLADPAWAHNEKIEINITGGKTGLILGGGFHGATNNEVAITVSGTDTTVGDIYGGAYGSSNFTGYATSTGITIKGGTITGSVYGGGYNNASYVKKDTNVSIEGGTVKGDVYGGGNGDRVEGNSTVTISGSETVVEGVVHGGGANGAVVEGEKTLNLGTTDAAFNGSIKIADFSNINADKGEITILSHTPAEEGTNLTVSSGASLTINGDFNVKTLTINGGTIQVTNGEITVDSVTLSDFSYEVYNPGYVGGGDNLNGFKQDSGRIAVGLDIGETLASVKDSDGVEYFYNGDLDRYVAPGATHWDIYYMNTSDHEAKASEIIEASKDAQGDALLQQIQMSAGTLGVNQSVYLMAAPATNENGEIAARPVINVSGDDTELSGMIDCATMHASGGKISATLHGDTSLTVTGDVEINGDSSQTGDTIITGPDAKLTIGTDTALGASTVKLQNQATLDLNHMAANNMIEVTGCTVANAENYVGRMEVASHMTFVGPASAGCISLRDKGAITAESLRTTTLEALSDKGADRYSEHTIIGDVTINDSGAIILYSGKQITLTRGSLTLGNGVAMVLLDAGGEFAVGDILVTCISGTITGDFSELDFLVNNEQQEGYRVEISEDRKSVVLAEEDKPIDDPEEEEEDKPIVDPGEEEEDKPIVGPEEDEEDKPIVGPEEDEEDKPIVGPEDDEEDKPIVGPDVPVQPEPAPVFDQATADVLAQGNWGVVSASRAFVGAVQGQRNNMGCIANGRGTAWASLLGGMTDISGSGAAAGSDITLFGAAVGVDMKVGKRSSLGVAFGYTDGEVSADGLGDIDQEGGHIALYGEHGLKKFANNSCLSLDWVAATGTTESKYMGAKWEQDSVQLNTRLTWNKQVTDRFSYNVFGGLEYFASESDRVENCKSGSVQNLRGELGVGVRYVAGKGAQPITDGKCAPAPACERVVLYGEVSYINDMVRNNPSIEVNGLRGSGANPGRQGVGVEAGATIRLGEKWSASANYSFNAMDDANEHVLNIGASRTF